MICSNHDRYTRGFTLIELMITLAIIAILVAFAVPAYKDYTVRSKVTECVNGAAVAKLSISEYRQTLGAWPPNLEEAGLAFANTSTYCTGLDNYQVSSGAFAINVNENAIDAGIATLSPVLTPYMTPSGLIDWLCSRGTTAENSIKYLPATCRAA